MTTPRTRALWRTVKDMALILAAVAVVIAGVLLIAATAFHQPAIALTLVGLLVIIFGVGWTLYDANLRDEQTNPYEAPYEDDDET